MKRLLISSILALALMVVPVAGALADTTATVTVTAVPSYISISNAPDTWDIGNVLVDTDDQTTNGYFTITNGSGVDIDITIQVTADWSFTTGSNSWTYGAAGADTAQLKASSGDNEGTGGTQGGAGSFDITIQGQSGSAVLFLDDITTTNSPTWEMQLDAPSSFTHGDAQECTVTLSATAAV